MNQNNLLYDVFREIFSLRVAPSEITNPNKFDDNYLDLFGVFVTIYRLDNDTYSVFQKNFTCNLDPRLCNARLDTSKMQVHGCIGHMEPDMQQIPFTEIKDHALGVGVSAARHDIRRQMFSKAIERDPFSVLHISYLRRPVSQMNPQNSNDDWGIICQNAEGLTTFLPKVFPGYKLGDVTNDLSEKAGATCFAFYQYKVYDFGSCFYSMMIETIQRQVFLFAGQLDEYFSSQNFIFYERHADGSTTIEKSEIIRNLACLECISKLPVNSATAEAVRRNLDEIKNLASMKDLGFHEKVSLLKNYNSLFCQRDFYQQVTETEFELGQYGIYYTKFCSDNKESGKDTAFSVLDSLQEAEQKQSSIFRLNWYCQMLWNTLSASLEKQRKTKKMMSVKKLQDFLSHTNFIAQGLLFYTNQSKFSFSYTNVLAVSFEALCFLLDVSNTLGWRDLCLKLVSAVFYVFLLLEQRCSFYTMFPFDDGTCRLDISCHVYNGMTVILKMAKK